MASQDSRLQPFLKLESLRESLELLTASSTTGWLTIGLRGRLWVVHVLILQRGSIQGSGGDEVFRVYRVDCPPRMAPLPPATHCGWLQLATLHSTCTRSTLKTSGPSVLRAA